MTITVHKDANTGQWASFVSATSALSVTCTTGQLVVAHICLTGNATGAEVISAIAQIAGQPVWTKRKQDNHHDAGGGRELNYSQEVWYFIATANSTNASAIVTASGGSSPSGCYSIHTFDNVRQITPWDANASVPTTSNITLQTDTSAAYSGLSTTSSPGMAIEFSVCSPRSGDTHTLATPGTGFTTLGAENNSGGSVGLIARTNSQYKATAAPLSSDSGAMTGTSTYIVSWIDAIVEAAVVPAAAIAQTLPALTQVVTGNTNSLDAETIAQTLFAPKMQAVVSSNTQNVQNDAQPFVYDAGAAFYWAWGM